MESHNKSRDNKMWQISKAFLDHHGINYNNLASFNHFLSKSIPETLEKYGSFEFDYEVENEDEEKTGRIVKHKVTFSNVYYESPKHKEINETIIDVTPKYCVDKNISYMFSIYVDVTYENSEGQCNIYRKKHIGYIPCMVMSDLCNLYPHRNDREKMASMKEDIFDIGGYFILDGAKKCLVSQVRPAQNIIHVYIGKKSTDKNKPSFEMYAETRSSDIISHSTKVQIGIEMKSKNVEVVIPCLDKGQTIPLSIVFMALGVTSYKDILSHIFPKNRRDNTPQQKFVVDKLIKTFENTLDIKTQEDALLYIGKRGKDQANNKSSSRKDHHHIEYARYLLLTEFLPHISTSDLSYFKEKAIYIGYMTQKMLLTWIGVYKPADRDHFSNKRIHTPGLLLASQFCNAVRQFTKKIKDGMLNDIQKNIPVNVNSYITTPHIIMTIMRAAIKNNKWNTKSTEKMDGISQKLDDYNMADIAIMSRKFVIAVEETAKIEEPRHIQFSQWGVACIYATPEGKKVGTVQGLSIGGYITNKCENIVMYELLDNICKTKKVVKMRSEYFDMNKFLNNSKIFIDGSIYGYTEDSVKIANQLRGYRRRCSINPDISIAIDDDGDIRICTDGGRIGRGLAIIENNKVKITEDILNDIKNRTWGVDTQSIWIQLAQQGYVEIVCKDEEENYTVALYPSDVEEREKNIYTHCELTPDMIQGVGVCTSPLNHMNQSPRNIYQHNMTQQAIGMFSNALYMSRGKKIILCNPQKPLVTTRVSEYMNYNIMGMGQNSMVAIIPWYGMNQEDSIVMSKKSIDRGFMNAIVFIMYEAIIKYSSSSSSKSQSFEIPTLDTCNDFKGNISKLEEIEEYVYIPEGKKVCKNDILIGVVTNGDTRNAFHNKDKTNTSVIYNETFDGIVHRVIKGINGDGYKYIRVIVAQLRKPILGDKFSARHGQKGTVGAILDSNEMPFLEKFGYTPDILVNPLAFPSRMTMGMLMEATIGAAQTKSAKYHDKFVEPLAMDNCDKKEIKEFNKEFQYSDGFNPETDYIDNYVKDGTPWNKQLNMDHLFEVIKNTGNNQYSEEIMINPKTGEKLKCLIFNAPVYYQRLKHMVVDKIHARAKGATSILHRQPVEGRNKGGGFKVGVMEKDCMMGTSIPYMTKDRMMDQSDGFQIPVCSICGLCAVARTEYEEGSSAVSQTIECKLCGLSECKMIPIPYGTKVVNQEFMAMGIVPRILIQ